MGAFDFAICRLCAAVLAVCLSLGAAGAQQPAAAPPETGPAVGPAGTATDAAPAATPPAVRSSGAAFLKPLGRLSSILGSVHFLRTLCGDADAAVWREKMNELIAAQAPNEADKQILVASFNGGYRSFESTYRKCTPAARLAVGRYQEEGAALSREIGARYGN